MYKPLQIFFIYGKVRLSWKFDLTQKNFAKHHNKAILAAIDAILI